MSITLSGRITFANGLPAAGVQVRLFDRDDPGQQDDDLTLSPGLTDSGGFFSLTYDPGRWRDQVTITATRPVNPPFDWTPVDVQEIIPSQSDQYQPYLSLAYTVNGQQNTLSVDLQPGQTLFTLPEKPNPGFLPHLNGFRFPNAFSGFFLPFALPVLPFLTQTNRIYGLCGGMAAAAGDFLLAGRLPPQREDVPPNGDPLQQYLFKRQLDSFGLLGETIRRYIQNMGLPDDTPSGLFRQSLNEFENKIRPALNSGRPVPIGLQYVKWQDSQDPTQNHQVLAYRYDKPAVGSLRIFIYDPNYPKDDNVFIEAERVPVGDPGIAGGQGMLTGLRCRQQVPARGETKKLYGFFTIPYTPVLPPLDLA